MKVRLTITAVAALLFAASADAATLTVSPSTGGRGTWVTMRGLGFPAATVGTLRFGQTVIRVRTNARGSFVRIRLVERSARLGARRIAATVGGRRVVALFRVQARRGPRSSTLTVSHTGRRISVSPAAGRAGTTVTVRGSGFPRRRVVRIAFGSSGQAPAFTTRGGSFAKSFRVPAGRSGPRFITVRSGRAVLRTLFTRAACSGVVVCSLPYRLQFDGNEGGKRARNGIGTGFRYVSQGRRGGRFTPALLTVNTAGSGSLTIRTTAGIAFRQLNSQDNALGVGLIGTQGVKVVQTTLVNPPAGTRNFEQGGLWFGRDQDNYAKLVVISHAVGGTRLQWLLEAGGVARLRNITPVMNLSTRRVTLILEANPTASNITVSYRLDGGPETPFGRFPVPNDFFATTYAGIFASHREGPRSVAYTFDDFSVAGG